MTITANKVFTFFFAALFMVAAALSAYLQEFFLLLIPFGVFASFYLVQHPQFLFYLLLVSIPWSIEFNFSQSLSTDLPDEPLMLLTALAAFIWYISRRKELVSVKIHPLLFFVVLQFAWTIFTVAVSTDFVLSFKYLLAKSWYLLSFLITPLFLFRNEKVFRRSIILLLCSMLVFMFFALARHAGYSMTFEKINDSLRPFFNNHVIYSALLVFMVPLQIAVIRLSASKRWQFVLSCSLVLSLGALYFSYARGAWLALATGLFTYWLIRKGFLVAGFLLCIVLCIASVLWLKSNDRYLKFSNDYNTTIFHTDFREHLIATYEMKDVSTAERFYRWIAGVRMVGDSWKTGSGPTSFYKRYKSYTIPAFKTWVSKNEEHSTVHNYFLLLIIEQGVIGLVLFLILIGSLFAYAQKIYHRTNDKFWKVTIAATAAILMMQCTVNFLSDLIETDKIGSIFYLCVATIIMADVKTNKVHSS